jgi:hypothetical protein
MPQDKIRAEQVIYEIIRQMRGELVGKTKLFKAFYFAHLIYAENSTGFLSEWPIVRMPHGPGIHASSELERDLVDAGAITKEDIKVGPFPTVLYKIAGGTCPGGTLPEPAVAAIQKAVSFVRDKSAAELSELTHEHSRSWNQALDGDELNVYIDMIPDDEYESRKRRLGALHQDLAAVFGVPPEFGGDAVQEIVFREDVSNF